MIVKDVFVGKQAIGPGPDNVEVLWLVRIPGLSGDIKPSQAEQREQTGSADPPLDPCKRGYRLGIARENRGLLLGYLGAPHLDS